jgi:hypothetical protein
MTEHTMPLLSQADNGGAVRRPQQAVHGWFAAGNPLLTLVASPREIGPASSPRFLRAHVAQIRLCSYNFKIKVND